MSEKSTEFNSISTQNSHFTDTGSAKTQSSSEIAEESTSNSENLNEIARESVSNSENSKENAPNSQKTSAFPPKSTDFLENAETKAQPPLNSASSKESDVQIADFFSEENKQAFYKDFPGVDLNLLRDSKNFQAFLGILHKNPTLSQVYACFNSIVADAEESSQKKLLQAMANAKSSVGALSSSQESSPQYFTKEQVLKMSPEQIKAHYSQIRKSQEKW